MPEKVHTKFGDTPNPNALLESHTQPLEKSATVNHQNPIVFETAKSNGVKRLRDGSPKLGPAHLEPEYEKWNQSKKPGAPPKSVTTDTNAQPRATSFNRLVSSVQATNGILQKLDLGKRPHQVQKHTSTSTRKTTQNRSSSQQLQYVAKQLEKTRKELPIWAKKIDIRWALRHNDVLLLNGETGSGKSTQVPQFLCTEPWCRKQIVTIKGQNGEDEAIPIGGMIVITQPRRVAAITLAHRVAREMGSQLTKAASGEVGYSVRFDTIVPIGAKIKFVTEGMLLQEMLHDPNLRNYSAVIVDEIHERSVDVDLLAGFLRQIIHSDKKGRGGIPLKLVVMSATLDLGGIEAFFARPETQPKYKPGQNHGRVLAEHLLNPEVDSLDQSDQSRSSPGESFSSWAGISNSGDESNHSTSSISKPVKTSGKSRNHPKSLPEGAFLRDEAHYGASENGVAVEYVQGRQHEVDIFYEANPAPDYLHNALQTILQLHVKEPLPGDILAFLSGQEEIETLQAQLEGYAKNLVTTLPKMKVMPLHGSLPAQAQQDVFERVKEHFTRKIVLATNIAETSVTVSGVRFVVDCGKAKVKQYRPRLGMESLLAKPISRVSAIQRAGRAGREARGKCFRVYTEQDYLQLEQDDLPEILRSDVIEAVLKMKARGVVDVLTFPLMDSPSIVAMEKALLQLHMMGALDDSGDLTAAGIKMASYPLPAALGRVLIAATELDVDVLLDVIDIISCLTTDSEIFLQPKSEEERIDTEMVRRDILDRQGDILTLLNTMRKYAAENTDRTGWCRQHLVSNRAMKMALAIRKQLRQLCFQQKLLRIPPAADPVPVEPVDPKRAEYILKAFLKGFSTRTALLAPDGTYMTTVGRIAIAIHPSSVLYRKRVEAIIFLDHIFTTRSYARKVNIIQADWITQVLKF